MSDCDWNCKSKTTHLSFSLKEICEKPKIYKHLRNYQFRITIIIITNYHATQGISWELAVTMSFGILLFSHRKWKGFLRSLPRKRATTVTLTAWKGWEHKLFTVKWTGNYNTYPHLYIEVIYFFTESGDPAAACQGGNEGLHVPRPSGAAQGSSVSRAGHSPGENSLPLWGFSPLGVTCRRCTNWGWIQEFSHWHLGWRSSPDKFSNAIII